MQRRKSLRYQTELVECLVVLIIALFCVGLIFYVYANPRKTPLENVIIKPELPSLIDIQKMLNKLEPENPIKADGVYGQKTKEKWERIWMNEQARKYFKGENHATELRQIQLRSQSKNAH